MYVHPSRWVQHIRDNTRRNYHMNGRSMEEPSSNDGFMVTCWVIATWTPLAVVTCRCFTIYRQSEWHNGFALKITWHHHSVLLSISVPFTVAVATQPALPVGVRTLQACLFCWRQRTQSPRSTLCLTDNHSCYTIEVHRRFFVRLSSQPLEGSTAL